MRQRRHKTTTQSLLLFDDDPPFVLFLAVHDVPKPRLHDGRIRAADQASGEGNVQVVATIVDM